VCSVNVVAEDVTCLWASSFLTFQTIVVWTSKSRELYAQRHDLTENVIWWRYV